MSNTSLLGSYGAQDNSSLLFRNKVINGDMRIDQRNAGASVTPTTGGYFTVDRWSVTATQSSKFSIQQNAGAITPPLSFSNYCGLTSLSSYSITASDIFLLNQLIEGFNVADFGWGAAGAQTVVLSFWVRSSLTGTFGGALRNSAGNRSYPFTYSISVANTWEQKTVVIPGDTSGTWLTNNGVGIRLSFGLGVGSTYSGAAGAWAGSDFYSATGATSLVGTNGATFYLTGVQLEAGAVATPFERRPFGMELALCQRYYEKSYELEDKPGTDVNLLTPIKRGGLNFYTHSDSSSDSGCMVFYKVTKRKSNNTVTTYTTSGTANNLYRTYSGGSAAVPAFIGYNSSNSVFVLADEGGVPAWSNTLVEFCWTCDAEL